MIESTLRKPNCFPRRPPTTAPRRVGFGQLEIIIAAIIVGVLTGCLSTLSYHIKRVYEDSRNYQIALYELSTQIRKVSALPLEEIPGALQNLQVSPPTLERLEDARLQGRIIDEESGKRLELEMTWARIGPNTPLRLTIWISSQAKSSSDHAAEIQGVES